MGLRIDFLLDGLVESKNSVSYYAVPVSSLIVQESRVDVQ